MPPRAAAAAPPPTAAASATSDASTPGRCTCEGRFLRRGRNLSFMESRFFGPDGKLAGMATATWKTPERA